MEHRRGSRGQASVIQRHVIISGRVQGVGFRLGSLSHAGQYASLCGFVRNRPDGSVEAVFAGKEEEVLSMVAWCKKGPSAAQVKEIEVKEEPYNYKLIKFHVLT